MVRCRWMILLGFMLTLQAFASAQAASAQLTQAEYEYDVEVSGAQSGDDYVLICVAGNRSSLSVETLLEDGALLFIRQVRAESNNFSFGGFVPSEVGEATLFIVDSGGDRLRAGVILAPDKGDLDGNGMITAADRELMLQYLAACIDISEGALFSADIDYSGYIDVADLSILDDMIRYGW